MNKTELVNAVAEKAGLTKAQAKDAVDAVVAAIGEALAKDDKVAILGFGTFATVEKGERTVSTPVQKNLSPSLPASKSNSKPAQSFLIW